MSPFALQGLSFQPWLQMHPCGGQQCDPEGAKSGLEKLAQLHNTSSSAQAEPAPARMEWASPPGSRERWSQVRLGLGSSPQARWTDPAKACQCLRRWVLSSPFQRATGNLHPSPEQPGWVRPCGPSSHPPGTSSGSTAHLSPSSPSPAESQELGRRVRSEVLAGSSRARSASPPAHSLYPRCPQPAKPQGPAGFPKLVTRAAAEFAVPAGSAARGVPGTQGLPASVALCPQPSCGQWAASRAEPHPVPLSRSQDTLPQGGGHLQRGTFWGSQNK